MQYQNKPTRQEAGQRLEKLLKLKADLEQKEIIKDYLRFKPMGSGEVARRTKAWSEYYQAIKQDKHYKLFEIQKELLKSLAKTKNSVEVAELTAMLRANGAIARQALADGDMTTRPRPPFRDAYEFYYNSDVGNYKHIIKALEGLQTPDEFKKDVATYLT